MAAHPERWIYELTDDDSKDIASCLDELRESKENFEQLEIHRITRNDINLGKFGQKIIEIRNIVRRGIGFQLIRGIQIQKYSRFEICLIYWCIGLYLGEAISQNGLVLQQC